MGLGRSRQVIDYTRGTEFCFTVRAVILCPQKGTSLGSSASGTYRAVHTGGELQLIGPFSRMIASSACCLAGQ